MLAPRSPKTFVTVDVLRDPRAARDLWRDLPCELYGSFYQSEVFVLNWLAACGDGVEPFFVVARDGAGAAVALLPLGIFRLGPLRLAQFLGGTHSNYNLGLFRDGDAFGAQEVAELLREAARAPGGPHLYRLLNLPSSWGGVDNPLLRLPHRKSSSPAYCTALGADGEAFLAQKLSADTRKKLRKKEKRLAEMGALTCFRAAPEQADAILDVYFAQKQRSYALGGEKEVLRTREFYGGLARQGLELHVLALDGRAIAMLATARNGGRLQGLFNTFAPDPEIAKSSPGDLLLMRVLRDACARGLDCFDLGLGEARYKAMFCGEREEMADVLFATGLAGAAAGLVFRGSLEAKAAIKNNPQVWRMIQTLRRRAARNRAKPGW